jgi:hypothetical protein
MKNVTFSYITDVDVPVLEKHFINHWQKRAKKINNRRQNSLNKKILQEEI